MRRIQTVVAQIRDIDYGVYSIWQFHFHLICQDRPPPTLSYIDRRSGRSRFSCWRSARTVKGTSRSVDQLAEMIADADALVGGSAAPQASAHQLPASSFVDQIADEPAAGAEAAVNQIDEPCAEQIRAHLGNDMCASGQVIYRALRASQKSRPSFFERC
jgi:hypothetical protein